MENNNNFDMVSALVNIFANPDTNYIFELYTVSPEEYDTKFEEVLASAQEQGKEKVVEGLLAQKEQLRQQAALMYKYEQFTKEKEKQTHRSYYQPALEASLEMQQSEDRETQILGDITTIQTYIHYVTALVDRGTQNTMVTNIYRHLQTHLFDVINDLMAICNLEDIKVSDDICQDLFNLSVGVDKDYEGLMQDMNLDLTSGFNFFGGESVCQ